MKNAKRKKQLSPEVEAAVNDILHGTSTDNHNQWLQREYIRLMRRECNMKSAQPQQRFSENRLEKSVQEISEMASTSEC